MLDPVAVDAICIGGENDVRLELGDELSVDRDLVSEIVPGADHRHVKPQRIRRLILTQSLLEWLQYQH